MNFRLTFTSTIGNQKIDFGNGLTILTPLISKVGDFTCVYATKFELVSNPLIVQDVSITGTQSASGTLDHGFTMSAGDGSAIILGNEIVVQTSWSLELSDVSLHYENCAVTQGEYTILIVKDGCMASSLGAELVANAATVTDQVSMKYRTFTIEGEVATTQEVKCDIKLCAGTTNCAKSTTCVRSNDPFNYQ